MNTLDNQINDKDAMREFESQLHDIDFTDLGAFDDIRERRAQINILRSLLGKINSLDNRFYSERVSLDNERNKHLEIIHYIDLRFVDRLRDLNKINLYEEHFVNEWDAMLSDLNVHS